MVNINQRLAAILKFADISQSLFASVSDDVWPRYYAWPAMSNGRLGISSEEYDFEGRNKAEG